MVASDTPSGQGALVQGTRAIGCPRSRRAVILVVAACPTAYADDVTVAVTLTPQGQQLAQGLGDSPDMLIQKVKTKVDDYYQVARVGQILREIVDATSFVNRDL